MSSAFRKLRIEILTEQQLEEDISCIKGLISELERENGLENKKLLEQLNQELQDKQERLKQMT